jgi:hypothetical protein
VASVGVLGVGVGVTTGVGVGEVLGSGVGDDAVTTLAGGGSDAPVAADVTISVSTVTVRSWPAEGRLVGASTSSSMGGAACGATDSATAGRGPGERGSWGSGLRAARSPASDRSRWTMFGMAYATLTATLANPAAAASTLRRWGRRSIRWAEGTWADPGAGSPGETNVIGAVARRPRPGRTGADRLRFHLRLNLS